MAKLSQHELEELVVGKPQKPTVVFYDKARINVQKSKKAGRRVYTTHLYIKEMQHGVTDWVAELAQPHHIKQYPHEYQLYLNGKRDLSPSIDIIPNITPAEAQELIDLHLGTIERLAEAKELPHHLHDVQRSAQVLQSVLMEQKNASKEKDRSEEVRTGEFMPAEHRSVNGSDVRQPVIHPSERSEESETSERVRPTGRIDSDKEVVWSDPNWSLELH